MMNLEKMKERKKEMHLTNQELAERSGVPLGTVNKIFSGATKSPKYTTLLALETVLGMYFYEDEDGPYVSVAREEVLLRARDELLDLCIAVAEKVVRVSLKSSSEVIVRMIQTATERLKRQEWVHIYISGCDTKSAAQISPALTTALGALSQHVKIIPMGDDEGGTCIVETPEEIIDASVSTQMTNIRDLLRDQMGAF